MRPSVKSRKTRQQILDAAQRLIELGGFSRLTTREIAREAGFAEGTIFKHFKRKDDLSLAVVLENAPVFRNMLAHKRAGSGRVKKNLEGIALAALRFCERLIPLAAALFADAHLLARQRKALNERGKGPKEAFELIAEYIREEQKLGRISQDVVPLAVSALLLGACFHRAFLRQALGKDVIPLNDSEFVASLVKTLISGIAPSISTALGRTRSWKRSGSNAEFMTH